MDSAWSLALLVRLLIAPMAPDGGHWQLLHPVPLTLTQGIARVDLAASNEGSNYLVIVAATDRELGRPTPVTLRATPVSSVSSRSHNEAHNGEPRIRAAAARHPRRVGDRRTMDDLPGDYRPPQFAQRRSFFLGVGEGDVYDERNYVEVTGRLVGIGERCLVYADEDDREAGLSAVIAEEVIETFDGQVHPRVQAIFGRHHDVDRDGRFTILLTPWLDKLAGGKVSLGGFVRRSDFHLEIDPPFGNRCDMMYLNSRTAAGEFLHALLAHEYAHAVTLSERLFGHAGRGVAGEDEESWLSEALAHLAEDLTDAGWSNLDHRVSAFLSDPSRYRLVVPDYHAAGLWRCHGSRGCTYSFLRWCVDQYGEELVGELIRSPVRGVANLERATGQSFEELFRDWSVAICVNGISGRASPGGKLRPLRSLEVHGRLGDRLLAGPRHIVLTEGAVDIELEPTAMCPIRIPIPAGQAVRLEVAADPAAGVQATLVPLPDDLPWVELELVSSRPEAISLPGPAGAVRSMRIIVRHRMGSPVRWDWLAREPLVPPGNGDSPCQIESGEAIFESPVSAAGDVLSSRPLILEATDTPLVFKLVGTDTLGRPAAAWTIARAPDKAPGKVSGSVSNEWTAASQRLRVNKGSAPQ